LVNAEPLLSWCSGGQATSARRKNIKGLGENFGWLPHCVRNGRILDARFTGSVPSIAFFDVEAAAVEGVHERDWLSHSLILRGEEDAYVVEYTLDPLVPTGSLSVDDYVAQSARRGAIEHYEFPGRLKMLSREWLEGRLTPPRDRLVPHSDDPIPTRRSMPFQPYGRWERLPPNDPFDARLRARLRTDRSICPYSFADLLNQLGYNAPHFDTLVVTYEPAQQRK